MEDVQITVSYTPPEASRITVIQTLLGPDGYPFFLVRPHLEGDTLVLEVDVGGGWDLNDPEDPGTHYVMKTVVDAIGEMALDGKFDPEGGEDE